MCCLPRPYLPIHRLEVDNGCHGNVLQLFVGLVLRYQNVVLYIFATYFHFCNYFGSRYAYLTRWVELV